MAEITASRTYPSGQVVYYSGSTQVASTSKGASRPSGSIESTANTTVTSGPGTGATFREEPQAPPAAQAQADAAQAKPPPVEIRVSNAFYEKMQQIPAEELNKQSVSPADVRIFPAEQLLTVRMNQETTVTGTRAQIEQAFRREGKIATDTGEVTTEKLTLVSGVGFKTTEEPLPVIGRGNQYVVSGPTGEAYLKTDLMQTKPMGRLISLEQAKAENKVLNPETMSEEKKLLYFGTPAGGIIRTFTGEQVIFPIPVLKDGKIEVLPISERNIAIAGVTTTGAVVAAPVAIAGAGYLFGAAGAEAAAGIAGTLMTGGLFLEGLSFAAEPTSEKAETLIGTAGGLAAGIAITESIKGPLSKVIQFGSVQVRTGANEFGEDIYSPVAARVVRVGERVAYLEVGKSKAFFPSEARITEILKAPSVLDSISLPKPGAQQSRLFPQTQTETWFFNRPEILERIKITDVTARRAGVASSAIEGISEAKGEPIRGYAETPKVEKLSPIEQRVGDIADIQAAKEGMFYKVGGSKADSVLQEKKVLKEVLGDTDKITGGPLRGEQLSRAAAEQFAEFKADALSTGRAISDVAASATLLPEGLTGAARAKAAEALNFAPTASQTFKVKQGAFGMQTIFTPEGGKVEEIFYYGMPPLVPQLTPTISSRIYGYETTERMKFTKIRTAEGVPIADIGELAISNIGATAQYYEGRITGPTNRLAKDVSSGTVNYLQGLKDIGMRSPERVPELKLRISRYVGEYAGEPGVMGKLAERNIRILPQTGGPSSSLSAFPRIGLGGRPSVAISAPASSAPSSVMSISQLPSSLVSSKSSSPSSLSSVSSLSSSSSILKQSSISSEKSQASSVLSSISASSSGSSTPSISGSSSSSSSSSIAQMPLPPAAPMLPIIPPFQFPSGTFKGAQASPPFKGVYTPTLTGIAATEGGLLKPLKRAPSAKTAFTGAEIRAPVGKFGGIFRPSAAMAESKIFRRSNLI